MQAWRVNFFGVAASVACTVLLVACGGSSGGGAVESGTQGTAEGAPAPREFGSGLAPVGTGAGSLRDFTLQVGGRRVNPPVTISTSDELRVVPDAAGALTSVVYWGDGSYADIKGGWNAGTPASQMSHRYAAAGSYQIEYATRDPNQGWDGRVLQITVAAGGTGTPPPAPMSGGSNRAFDFFVNGAPLAAPFTINTSTTLTVVPAATGAETSVIHWGDGSYSAINGGWNANTPVAQTQHRYGSPATYRVEYATRYPGGNWDSMVREITVVAGSGPAQSPPPAPAPGAAWRPFNASSPWNTPIAANPALEADSAALIDAFRRSSPYGEHLDVNIARFSIPLYQAAAGTPLQTVATGLGGEGWGPGGPGASGPMPIPAGATPDPSTDAHMAVITADRTKEYGCFNMNFNRSRAGAWYADLCAISDLTGSGVRPPATAANPWWAAHGARACGYPLVAGLIRADEIRAGRIDHALVFAYPALRRNRFMPPASTNSDIGADYGIPCGGRIQFDPNVDVTKLGLSPAGVTIMRALQQYGAYVGDYSGALSMYADNSPDASAYWNSGVLGTYELRDKIDMSKFRVIKYDTVYTWPPGS
jgi:major membrane immunogen (membrane-anchored lipoprotein)